MKLHTITKQTVRLYHPVYKVKPGLKIAGPFKQTRADSGMGLPFAL